MVRIWRRIFTYMFPGHVRNDACLPNTYLDAGKPLEPMPAKRVTHGKPHALSQDALTGDRGIGLGDQQAYYLN